MTIYDIIPGSNFLDFTRVMWFVFCMGFSLALGVFAASRVIAPLSKRLIEYNNRDKEDAPKKAKK
jgi:hypothetical protein